MNKYKPLLGVSIYIFLVLIFIADGARIHRDLNSTSRCNLPQHPINGKWAVAGSKSSLLSKETTVPSDTILTVTCNGQLKLNGSSVIKCKNGQWSDTIGNCLSLCPPIRESSGTKVVCTLKAKATDCMNAVSNTVATFKCAPFYENFELNRNPFRTCQNGSWDQEIPTCAPVCGVKSKITTDDQQTKTYYPWNVAIYKKMDKGNAFHCAGTLINERVILTAAHCISDQFGTKHPTRQYTVAAAKSFEKYNDLQDEEAQYSDVDDMFLPEGYKGMIRKYADDIAVLVTQKAFNMSRRIQPVCFDWSNKFAKQFQDPKTNVFMAGPLVSPYFPSKAIGEIEVPLVNDTQCYLQLSSGKIGEPNFESHYTYQDKFCSGYINSDRVPKCRINHGTGLVLRNPNDNKYYVIGVTSSFPSIHSKNCDNQKWVLFTKVFPYTTNFILDKNNLYTPITKNYFQPLCGVKSVTPQILIINGNNVTKGDYPWQVAIYQITNTQKILICSGSLISQRILLTAAHCVTDLNGETLSKDSFIVAVGKYYRNFEDPRDAKAQFSTLKDIFVPNLYVGEVQNFVGDIAILITENTFILSRDVQPVCVDWNRKYENDLLNSSLTGFVAGWGFTQENSDPSETLKDLEVPYIERNRCKKYLPRDYEEYLTYDKICSGYLNESRAVCSGDSGGGLVFRNINDGKYYITGIVSLSPQAESGGCNSQQYTLYTKVSQYIPDFILQKVQFYLA